MEAPRSVLPTCMFFLQALECQAVEELALGVVLLEQAAQQLPSLAAAFLNTEIDKRQ